MAVTFNAIPGNLRVPLFYAEINAGFSPTQSPARCLLIGGLGTLGVATPNQPMLVPSGEDGLFGVGSMLAIMVKRARAAAPFQELWALPIPAGSAVSAVITVPFAASFTGIAAGEYAIYVGDQRVSLRFDPALFTIATFATALAAAINSVVPVTEFVAAATATSITLTSTTPGAFYNSAKVQFSLRPGDAYLSAQVTPPAGVAVTTASTDPSFTLALANLGADEYDYIALPYSSATSLAAIVPFLDARWGPMQQLYGSAITYVDGTVGALQTLGSTYNSPNLSIYGGYNFSSTASAITATLAAMHAQHLQSAPELSRPLQTLALPGVIGPKLIGDRQTIQQQNTLLYIGISTMHLARDGSASIGRAITTYQKDAYGSPDQSFLSVNTRAQNVYGVRYMRQYVQSIHGRSALVDANPTGIENFVTADELRGSMLHAYQNLCELGVFDQFGLFAAALVVERDLTDPNRVNAYLPFAAVNQLTVFAANVTSYLRLGA